MYVLSVIIAGILWGSMSIFVRALTNYGLDPKQIMMMRSIVAAVLLGVFIFVKDKSLFKIQLRHLWIFLCSGIISLALFSVCYFSAIIECGASVAVVLLYTSPVFVLILAALFLKEKITVPKIMALILTVCGCILVTGVLGTEASRLSIKGIAFGLCSGLCYGLYSIFGNFGLKHYRPFTVTFYSFLIAALVMIPLSSRADCVSKLGFIPVLWCIGVGIVCTLVPFMLYTFGLSGLNAGKAAIFATVEPLVGTLIGIFLWKEDAGLLKLLGIVLIFAAILICQKSVVKSFFKKHHFKSVFIVREIIEDMRNAAESDFPGKGPKGQDMFRTWMVPPEKNPANEKVIVIDAGGTNFRSCLVTFDLEGTPSVSDFKKSTMPAIDREYSKEEFFAAIADRIDYLKNKSDKIGFCFSYAMNITKEHDGIPNAFSKEVKAKEVLGVPVGKNLVEELEKRGWNKIKKITLLNDTVSALLAGVSGIDFETLKKSDVDYDSYIGFILGTGMNAAFIDENNHLKDGRQIIVCESGKCRTIELSDFDRELDRKTDIPGQYPLEKCCSGAYLGKVGWEILMCAAKEKLFTKKTCERLLELKELSTIDMNDFLFEPVLSELGKLMETETDRAITFELLDGAVDRCAKYAASILTANLIVCGKGTEPSKPVCIVCNGTTLYKSFHLKERMEKYLYQIATKKQKIYFRTVCIENDITVGTAVAGLI